MNDTRGTSGPEKEKIYADYKKWKFQKAKIVEGLLKIDPNGKPLIDWSDLNEDNILLYKNWFFGFCPSYWGRHKGSGFGVAFWFYPFRDRYSTIKALRVNVGAESPLKKEHKDSFKQKIVDKLSPSDHGLKRFSLWPNAGIQKGKVILEARYDFDANMHQKVVQAYSGLSDVIKVIGDEIRAFQKNGAFKVSISFQK